MLYSSTFSNFTSFRDDLIFDLAAPKNRVRRRYPGNFVQLESGELLLKYAVLAGENAGGKSNFVKAFRFLRSLFVRNDVVPRSSRNLVFCEGAWDAGDGSPTTLQPFEIEIAIKDYFLRYTLHVDEAGIVLEQLERSEKSPHSYRLVFRLLRSERSIAARDDRAVSEGGEGGNQDSGRYSYRAEVGSPLGISRELLASFLEPELDPARLMVITLSMLGERSCKDVVSWFTSDLVIASRSGGAFIFEGVSDDSLDSILHDERYFEILRLADASIADVKIDRDNPFGDSGLIRTLPSGKTYEWTLGDDSAGIIDFAQWAVIVYLVVYGNKTVFADEVDGAIDPVLAERALAFVNGKKHRGQLVFTTHNVLSLTLRTLLKEQIYFVTKDPDTLASTLYALSDFSDVRYDVKGEVYDLYMRGMLGGALQG
ncbi:hypothetical protein B5F74_10670 [Collinsella sp. An271]|uniref:AAA family ATPase n=1 Tax=Collinsella sp. An271 TaxID=1965616 RepID=UPI000B3828DC|nr:AAA family ATPase [Collinsella sp. An271]OUO58229.1 hypothetical protein B5F74_10670 [Collinsella sp. An271]